MKNTNFSDQLLSMEQVNPTFQERYEKEIKKMLEKTLNPIQRFMFGFSAAMGAAFAIGFAYVAVVSARELPLLIRGSFGFGALVGLIWAIIAGKIVASGKMNLRTHPNAMNGLIWGFLVILQVVFMTMGGQHPDRVLSVFMILNGLTFLMMGATFMINNSIEQSELNVKEKLLGIELRLAEIAEALPK